MRSKLTGQFRDTETGEDYFNARYFGAVLGRLTSPDPMNAGANPVDPQTWNAYAYVRNSPLVLADPTGRNLVSPADDLWDGSAGAACFMCGGGGGGGGGSVLAQQEAQNESGYAANLQQTYSDIAAAQLANNALKNGDTYTAGYIAATNSKVVAVPVAPQTSDAVYNALAGLAPSLNIDPNTEVPVNYQQQGSGTAVQAINPGTGAPYQTSDLNFSPGAVGTADPSAISALYHGSGNPSWYIGGETNAIHLVDLQNAPDGFYSGLQWHVDPYNAMASVGGLVEHFFGQVLRGGGPSGPVIPATCSINGGCH